MKYFPWAGIGLCWGLAACSGDKFVGRSDLTVVQQAELPAPLPSDLTLQQRPYIIGPSDKLSIAVYNVPELSAIVQVDASGSLSLPLVGMIEAAGKTTRQMSEIITTKLRSSYVRDPQVTVNVDTTNQSVTVDGQVEHPGLYPILGRMTLMRAVATAQGMTEFAAANYVIIYRTVNNHQMAALHDLRAIRAGMYADPEVYPNDIVVVGESGGRRIFQSIIQGSTLLTAPIVALLN